MPESNETFVPRQELLTFEELTQIAELLVRRCGIREIRLTGGEPLVRKNIDQLIQRLTAIPNLQDLSLTTNGMLLAEHASALREAGLKRVNISLDTLDADTFLRISRRPGLERVIAGIDAAIAAEFESIKLNALAIKGVTEQELIPLMRFADQRGVELRFIEFMPLDADRLWQRSSVLSGDDLIQLITKEFGPLKEISRANPSQPAAAFVLGSGQRIGIIRSVTAPFCESCDRLRLTADGSLRNCLFSKTERPLRDLLRRGATEDELVAEAVACVREKRAMHGIDSLGFVPPNRPMYAIGG
jgi:cyclic pyranopterin phosphate synthase